MGRVVSSKVVLAFAVLVVVGLSLVVEGVRDLKDEPKKAEMVHPENFFGGLGGIFPSPGGSSFGTRTGPGLGSSVPSVDFCSVPSLGCVRVEPTLPGSTGASGSGSNTPLPFP